MVQPDLVDQHALGRHAEQPRDLALEADRHVAQPDRAVAGVEQRARDDADRVREVDDPGVRARPARATRSAISSTTGTVRSALANPPAPVVSCPMQPQRERHGLVVEPRRLAADADLDSTASAPSSARSRSPVTVSSPPKPWRSSIRARQPADDLAPLGVDVVQDQLANVEPVALAREPGHELGRVRRAAADDRDLHPLTPVSVTPSTNAFWAAKKSDDDRRHEQQRRGHGEVPLHLVEVRNCDRPTETVQWSGFSPV